jgi:hypothetical protein
MQNDVTEQEQRRGAKHIEGSLLHTSEKLNDVTSMDDIRKKALDQVSERIPLLK